MVDLATVGYKVDTTGLATSEKALNVFHDAHRRMTATQRYAAELAKFNEDFRMANRELKERVATLESDVEKLKSDVAGLRSNVLPLEDVGRPKVQEEHQPDRPLPSKPFKMW